MTRREFILTILIQCQVMRIKKNPSGTQCWKVIELFCQVQEVSRKLIHIIFSIWWSTCTSNSLKTTGSQDVYFITRCNISFLNRIHTQFLYVLASSIKSIFNSDQISHVIIIIMTYFLFFSTISQNYSFLYMRTILTPPLLLV